MDATFPRLRSEPPTLTAELVRVIESRATRDETTGCLMWRGSKDRDGYAQVQFLDYRGGVSRLIARHYLKTWDPALNVCHTCDRPPCINHKHLFMGTDLDNHLDKQRKGSRPSQTLQRRRTLHSLLALGL